MVLFSVFRKGKVVSRRWGAGLLLAILCLFPVSLAAKPADELRQVEQALAAQKGQADALARQEKAAAQDLKALQKQLIDATASLQEKQDEQEQLEERSRALEDETTARAGELDAARARLADLSEALTRLSRQPPATFLLHGALTDDVLHRALLLRSLLPRLQTEATSLAQAIQDLEMLRQTAAAQKRLVIAARQNLAWQQDNLDAMIKARQGRLQKTAAQKAVLDAQRASLVAEAQDLRQLLDKITASRPRGDAASLRQGLKMPVAGRVVRRFGEKDSYGVASDGITIEAASGSRIVAPQDGRVAFTGPFRGYGQIVILQHQDGTHSFLAGFSRIDAEVGQTVVAGEPLGVLSSASEGRPSLYFEWRKRGEPADPLFSGSPVK